MIISALCVNLFNKYTYSKLLNNRNNGMAGLQKRWLRGTKKSFEFLKSVNQEKLEWSNGKCEWLKNHAHDSRFSEGISRPEKSIAIDTDKLGKFTKSHGEKKNTKESGVQEMLIDLNAENQYERLCSVMTKFWKFPYQTQLTIKYKMLLKELKKLQAKLSKSNFKHDGSPWKLQPIIPASVINSYRCKDEFSVGHGVDGDSKTIGFYLGRFGSNNPVYCVRPDELNTLKQEHKDVARAYESYIKSSPFDACYNLNDNGVWRGVTVRSNRANELLVTIMANPRNLNENDKKEEAMKLKSYFENLADELFIKSLYIQYSQEARPTAESTLIHLLGEKFLHQTINGLKYRITPNSIFHANVDASEVFNKTMKSLCFLKEDSAVVNVNSLVGTLDLYLAKFCQSVVGLTSTTLVNDAQHNADLNDIKNAKLLSGNYADVLPEVLNSSSADDNVLILNLGQVGFPSKIIEIVKEARKLDRVIVTTTNLKEAIQANIVRLCKPNSSKQQSFKLMYCVPIDMTPQTSQADIILLFCKS